MLDFQELELNKLHSIKWKNYMLKKTKARNKTF